MDIENASRAMTRREINLANPEVKAVCLAESSGEACVIPGIKGVIEHIYPISHPLYMYTNKPASGEVKSYLDRVLSDEGQCILLNNKHATVRKAKCEG